jgi:predicted MFS family arabinose efflux permease
VKAVLKLPAYRRLLSTYTLNELAWWVGSVALAVLVYRRTGTAMGAAAFFLSAQFVPALISPLVVARLDRRSPRGVLVGLYTLESIAFLALARMAKDFVLAAVLAIALFDGVIALTARALARATTVSVTRAVGLLREGNAITNGSLSISYMVGPALGGVAVAAGGTVAALLVNSGLFVLMALILVSASALPGPREEVSAVRGRVRAALSYAMSHRMIRRIFGVQTIAVVFFTISIPVEVVFAQHSLRAGASGYGFLLSSWGAGAVIGSAVYARWRSRPSYQLITLGAALPGVGFLVMATAPSLELAIFGAAVAGAGNGIEVIAATTMLQEVVEERWMAMMMSLDESIFQAVPGVGIILGGAIATVSGPRAALAVGGLGAAMIAAVMRVLLRTATGDASGETPFSPEATPQNLTLEETARQQ